MQLRLHGARQLTEREGFRQEDRMRDQGFLFGERLLELKMEARNIFGRGYSEFQRNGGNVVYYNKYDVGTSFGLSLSMNF